MKLRNLIKSALLAAGLTAGYHADAATIQVTANMNGNVTWYRTNEYVLNGFIYVLDGGTLNIEAGTVVRAKPGTQAASSALYITQGAKIYAEGTPTQPIIFTSEDDDLSDPNDIPNFTRGKWGGIVLMGKASINTATDSNGNNANPKYEVFEGLPDTQISGQFVHRFGGNQDDDSSGVMRYVSIRYAGTAFQPDKELNGLSLGAVGRGTTLEYVEAYAAADDGFEFFGGTVNTKHLVSAFNDDDCFDIDMGYRGKNQFWFAIQEPGAKDNGGEWNGEPNGTAVGASPVAAYQIYNGTWIGAGTNTTGNRGLQIREYAAPKVFNSILTEFGGSAVRIDAKSATHISSGTLDLRNNIFWNFANNGVAAPLAETVDAQVFFTDVSRTNLNVNPMLNGISRAQDGGLDPRPAPGSPALTTYSLAPSDGFYEQAAYAGAFNTNELWVDKWTFLSQKGFTPTQGVNTIQVTANITGNVTWYRTNEYVLNGFIYVLNGGTLNIEAGTVVRAQPGTQAASSALYITQGAKIYAMGTPTQPIIFTSVNDDLTDPDDIPNFTRGLWGGIVLMGKASINTATDVTGNNASPKYEVFEGLPDTQISGQFVHRFGGNQDNDSSGVMRYVSIRYAGTAFQPDKELNGLSLGAVGRGTTLEFVEAYAAADDGFEFFGGTVNTKYLISAFNDDDCFDIDMGFRGKNQFWFAIQEPGKKDNGGEWNGEPNGTAVGASPVAAYQIYNGTWIGAGTNTTGNRGLTIREYAAPKLFNSILTDFGGNAVAIDSKSATHISSGTLDLRNNIFWNFATNGVAAAMAETVDAQIFFTDTFRTNRNVNPQLRGISRSQDNGLDPRPATGSPAFTTYSTPTDSYFTPVKYAGAFGDYNWMTDWSFLSDKNFLTTFGGRTPVPPASSAPTGPSTATAPYVEPLAEGVSFTAILTTGDAIGGYRMGGIPDGMGAFDNGDGTYTLVMNHELGNTAGINRAHGAKGAYVSKWIISKTTQQVISGQDLMTNVYTYNSGTTSWSPVTYAFNRFCSADLAAATAFYNSSSGLGTVNRIFMNGEEAGDEGLPMAHIVNGPDAGKSFEVPHLGNQSFENVVANPHMQDKTIVATTDDTGGGQIYFYVGSKTSSGDDIHKAGLVGGNLYGLAITGIASETDGMARGSYAFTMFNLGDVSASTGANIQSVSVANNVTGFQRPEDGAWDPTHHNDFYFVTTRAIGAPSRLWRVHFNDIANPDQGGTVDMLLDGTEGQAMMDNMCIDAQGNIIIQEDPGNNVRLARLWKYYPATGGFIPLGQAKADIFLTGAANFITQDEEHSGVFDMSAILGDGYYLFDTQVHSSTPVSGANQTELVEGGQLTLMYISGTAPTVNTQPTPVNVGGGTAATFTVAATTGAQIQWYKNGVPIGGATGTSYSIPSPTTGDAGEYTAVVTAANGSTSSTTVSLTVTEIAMYAGVAVAGPIGTQYDVQFTTDLSGTPAWTTLERITLSSSPTLYIDQSSPGQAKRFYRALEVAP